MATQTFVNLPVKDLTKATKFFTRLGFSFDDDLAEKALAAGGQALGEPDEQDFMYMRGFRDLDGHQWSFIYMDMTGIPAD